MVLLIVLLGIGVTYAEPAIGALKTAGQLVQVEKAPYLYALLNDWSGVLVIVVGIGVGIAAVLGTMRFLYGWTLTHGLRRLRQRCFSRFMLLCPELAKIGRRGIVGAVTTDR